MRSIPASLFGVPVAVLVLTSASIALGQTAAKPLSDDFSRTELASVDFQRDPDYVALKALPKYFSFPTDARTRSTFGLDLSHYQGKVAWSRAAGQRVAFAYVKATQGADYYDGLFARNWSALAALPQPGILRGAYHFMTAGDDPALQAQNYARTVGALGPRDLPPVLDMEWDLKRGKDGQPLLDAHGVPVDAWAALTPAQITDRMKLWLDAVERASGRRPVIYTSANWWKQRVGAQPALAGYRVWVADYGARSLKSEKPRAPTGLALSFWQFTPLGRFQSGQVAQDHHFDISVFNGTPAQFLALMNPTGGPS